jgi:transcription initiation factor TFIID TATA-box-binding protein
MLTIQNVVGGGSLGVEIDLFSIATAEFEHFDIQYEPESFPGVVFRSTDLNPTIMLYRSGKFNIAGGDSVSETREAFNIFCTEMTNITELEIQPNLEIRYFVTTGKLGRRIDLLAAAIALGIDETEYEPEQFPGLFYRPENQDWFAILFASGSIVVDGVPNMDILESAYEEIDQTLSENDI